MSEEENMLGAFTLIKDVRILSQEEFEDVKKAIKIMLEKNKELERKLKIKNGDIDYISNKINNHFIDDVTLKDNYISKDKIRERLEQTKKVYDEEMKPYMLDTGNGEKILNITYLNKKEKEELINKRNCLLVQIKAYEMLLEEK